MSLSLKNYVKINKEKYYLFQIPAPHSHTKADRGCAIRVSAGPRLVGPLGLSPGVSNKNITIEIRTFKNNY